MIITSVRRTGLPALVTLAVLGALGAPGLAGVANASTPSVTVALIGNFTTTPGIHTTIQVTVPSGPSGCPISPANELLLEVGDAFGFGGDGTVNNSPPYLTFGACD